MPGVTLSPAQRVALAAKLDVDPWGMTAAQITARALGGAVTVGTVARCRDGQRRAARAAPSERDPERDPRPIVPNPFQKRRSAPEEALALPRNLPISRDFL